MSRSSDLIALLRGIESVRQALVAHQQRELARRWANSSLRTALNEAGVKTEEKFSDVVVKRGSDRDISSRVGDLASQAKQTVNTLKERSSKLAQDIQNAQSQMKVATSGNVINDIPDHYSEDIISQAAVSDSVPFSSSQSHDGFSTHSSSSGTVSMMGNFGTPNAKSQTPGSPSTGTAGTMPHTSFHHDSTVGNIRADDLDQAEQKKKYSETKTTGDKPPLRQSSQKPSPKVSPRPQKGQPGFKYELNQSAKERKVPGTRVGRLMSFGGLAAGLGAGALAEAARRGLGLNKEKKGHGTTILESNPFMTEKNAERIVSTLCRVRGAALKLGQMISIGDNRLISPELQQVFERVRQSADFMPVWQMERVMSTELGSDWKSKLAEFDSKPFAAASIGQVHQATLHDGRDVAMKIQYPGVAQSIDSDINNLLSILSLWNILPEGMYLEKVMSVARRELAWEVDYIREANCAKRFREMVADDPMLYVPEIIDELTTKQVLTAELVYGVTLDKLQGVDQKTKNKIAQNILHLCLREVFEFRFMQTDPNWSNFLWNNDLQKIMLLDFGASRAFGKEFTDDYLEVIKYAALGDRDGVYEYSTKLGFLTGYESKIMREAHVDAVMILGEAFQKDEPFSFGTQSTASRIHDLIPVMLRHRLTPPPEETYSLHRKMAGCFLLCTKLEAEVTCKPLFDEIYHNYKSGYYDDVGTPV